MPTTPILETNSIKSGTTSCMFSQNIQKGSNYCVPCCTGLDNVAIKVNGLVICSVVFKGQLHSKR